MAFKFVDKTLEGFQIGDSYSFAKTVTEADVVLFAGVSGDLGPHHVNAQYAKSTGYGERIAHSMLTASLASAAIGRMLSPGFASASYEFHVTDQVRIGDTITATVTVAEKVPAQGLMKLRIVCTNQMERTVLQGTSTQVMIERKEPSMA